MTQQIVKLPYPPPQLNPNARLHPARRGAVAKRYKRTCWALALEAKLRDPGTPKIGLRLEFTPPDLRTRDDDNAESAFKSGRDGLAAAMKVDDNRFKVLSKVMAAEPQPGGFVRVAIEPMTG